jgi:hypothetical protein
MTLSACCALAYIIGFVRLFGRIEIRQHIITLQIWRDGLQRKGPRLACMTETTTETNTTVYYVTARVIAKVRVRNRIRV